MLDKPLRSRDFGSPQCRLRLYVIGVQTTLLRPNDFRSMINFLTSFLPGIHSQAGVSDVVRFVAGLNVPQMTLPACTKDWTLKSGVIQRRRDSTS